MQISFGHLVFQQSTYSLSERVLSQARRLTVEELTASVTLPRQVRDLPPGPNYLQ
jgi:hypothetical protein